MSNRLLARADAALDDIAAATGYAHPLVDPAAVAWLEEQADAGCGPSGDRWRRPYPNEAASYKDDTCSCFDDPSGDVVCGWQWTSVSASPSDATLIAFTGGDVGSIPVIIGTADPVIPSNVARRAAMDYASAHHRPARDAELTRGLADRAGGFIRYSSLYMPPPV